MSDHEFNSLSEAAEAGQVEAQYRLGLSYLKGDGVEQNVTKGMTWLERSAGAGFARAMMILGVQYRFGKQFPRDDDAAIKWFRMAARTGSEVACSLLVGIYKDRKDPGGELKWNKGAALRGCLDSLWEVRKFYECTEDANLEVGEAYVWLSLYEDIFTRTKLSRELWAFQLTPGISEYRTSSREVEVLMSASDLERAIQVYRDCIKERVKWIRKKAEQGSPNAQYELGWCYENGYGALKDYSEATRWYREAALQGHTEAATEWRRSFTLMSRARSNTPDP